MRQKMVIVGIDPGTISAYAILSLDGDLVAIGSQRNQSSATIIHDITQFGKIYTIGCDVTPCPHALHKIASAVGARMTTPDHNLAMTEKIKIVDTYLKKQSTQIKFTNKHEKDALAGALYTLKRMNPLLKRIKDHLTQEHKIFLLDDVRTRVLLENMPITKVLTALNNSHYSCDPSFPDE